MPIPFEAVHTLLLSEVEDARRRLETADMLMREVVRVLPIDAPEAESTGVMRKLREEQGAALDALRRAIQRHRTYAYSGQVPADLC